MKRNNNIIGAAGLVLLLTSFIWYSISQVWEVTQWILLALGILGSIYYSYIYFTTRDKQISSRAFKKGSNILVQAIITVVIIAMLAFISTKQNIRSDWTENSLYSLSDQTAKILESLEKEVEIKAFYKAADQNAASDLLDEYAYRSSNLSYETVDPDEKPQIAKRYDVQKYNQIVVESGFKRETIDNLTEAALTNAIIKVTREQDKVIYFLSGHGERSVKDEGPKGYKSVAEAIGKENHLVRELNLVRSRTVPDSCSLLAIVSPQSNFFPGELDSIITYLENGGKVLLLSDPEYPQELNDFALNFGVDLTNDVVVDASGMGQLLGGGPLMPLATNYDNNNAITKGFEIMTFYPMVHSVAPASETNGYTVSELVKTSDQSFAIQNLDINADRIEIKDEDRRGPISLAALAEKTDGSKKNSLLVFGDSDFASNAHYKNQGNANLFLNTVNYLAEEEDMISIRPKEVDDRRLTLTQADVSALFYLIVIAIPLIVIVFGVVVFIRRNKA